MTRGPDDPCGRDGCGSTGGRVRDSRPSGSDIRRRRRCMICGHRWTTLEVSAAELGLLERARDTRRNAALHIDSAVTVLRRLRRELSA